MSDDDQASREEKLCGEFANTSLHTNGNNGQSDELIFKGKHRVQSRTPTITCQEKTKVMLKEVLLQRRPIDYEIDQNTLDTPIHRFLEAPDNYKKLGCNLIEPLNQMLAKLSTMGLLSVYVNMPNKLGRTPLSLCLKSDSGRLADLIGPLVRHGAQLHHLCGVLAERCNHLHYAMLKGAPNVIDAALDEVFHCYPFGADCMYAMNARHETPKASLQRRIHNSHGQPELQQKLSLILDRIQVYPPIEGVPQHK